MQYDYYAFRKEQLSDSLNELEQAKQLKDKNARKQAIEQAAKKSVDIEPHLAYFWFWAKKEESDKEAKFNSEIANSIRDAWQKDLESPTIPDAFNFTPKDFSALNYLPPLSFMLRVPFKLRKPYLSKEDRAFHILDNPVRKDKVFQTPMVASTSWKGALQSAMLQQFAEWWCNLDQKDNRTHQKEFVARRVSLGRLFGTEKGFQNDEKKPYLDNLGNDHLSRWYRRYIQRQISSSGFFSGRLYFYPTFFDKISLEVINPHNRKTGVGKNPILIESVPGRKQEEERVEGVEGAKGDLVILYVPFGKVDKKQVAQDLEWVTKGVCDLLTVYGFGAKTTSGFGVVEDQLNGQGVVVIRADSLKKSAEFPTKEEYKNSKVSQKKPYSERIYEIERERAKIEFGQLPKKSFDKLSQLCDRAQEIVQELSKSQ